MGVFPDELTNWIDGVTEITAARLNAPEVKIGANNSLVPSTLDYLLKNPASVDPGHKHDHGGFNGLNDDDHTQYIKHSLATAANNFLVASGAGAYVTKTLAETRAILSLPELNYAVGDLLYASSTSALSKLAAVVVGQVLVSGGVGAPPAWSGTPTLTRLSLSTILSSTPGTSMLHMENSGIPTQAFCVRMDANSHLNVDRKFGGWFQTLLIDRMGGNVGIGVTALGTSATKVLGIGSGTAPTTFPSDMAQMCVKDQAAGNACFHFYSELGQIIKLYKQAHINNPTDLATCITAITSILTYMENLGFNATA